MQDNSFFLLRFLFFWFVLNLRFKSKILKHEQNSEQTKKLKSHQKLIFQMITQEVLGHIPCASFSTQFPQLQLPQQKFPQLLTSPITNFPSSNFPNSNFPMQ